VVLFLSFSLSSLPHSDRKARTAVNPRTLEKINVPAKKTVTFKVSPEFKATLNKQ
jgi:nucleoid DNA-binding protein